MTEPPTDSRPTLVQHYKIHTDDDILGHSAPNTAHEDEQGARLTSTASARMPEFEPAALLAQGSNLSSARLKSLIEALKGAARKLDPTLQQALTGLWNEAHHLAELGQSIQELAWLQRDATILRFEPIELGDLLMNILPEWKARAPQHALELALPGEIPTILADTRHTERAINLLIGAAIAFAAPESTIRVSIRPQVDDVLVTIQYAGMAFSEYESQHLFEPFYQPERAPANHTSGVGLTLARAILLAHGGSLWAQSNTEGHESALAAAWPLVPAPPLPLEAVVPSAETSAQPPIRERLTIATQRPVILVLDNDSRMLRYLRTNLDAQRYKPVLAKDADEVWRLVDLEEPDLLLLDLHSLGAEQEEIDALIQELQAQVAAPIICLARQSDPLECARLLDLGAADYLAKPFSLEELLARIRVALRTREAVTRATARERVFRSGDLMVDFAQRQVMVGDRPIALSKTEFKLLRVLAEHAGMVLAHEVLLSRVWGLGYSEEIEFVWVYIRRLRKKIEPDPSAPTYIQTVPGVGYRLTRL